MAQRGQNPTPSPLSWQELEASCQRLDSAEIRIESLDLSCMEEDSPVEEYPSEDEDEGTFMSAEMAVALLTRPSVSSGGVPLSSSPLLSEPPLPSSPTIDRPTRVPRAIGHSESWGSMISTASTFQSDESSSSALHSELSIGSDTDIASLLQRSRLSSALEEPQRMASEKLHRLAMVSHSGWEEESNISDTLYQESTPTGTPIHSQTSQLNTLTPGRILGRDLCEFDCYSPLSDGHYRLEGKAKASKRAEKARSLREERKPSRESSNHSERDGEVGEKSAANRKLGKGSSFPTSHKKEEKLVIPSIMAEIDPTWDLWEGKNDFSGSGGRDESTEEIARKVVPKGGGGVRRVFGGLFSKTKH